jgi:hypothetical protein
MSAAAELVIPSIARPASTLANALCASTDRGSNANARSTGGPWQMRPCG